MREKAHDILFESVRIGPKTARNRFYQVPHCNGMGYRHPRALAAMRGVKAEGGWAVVSTEEAEIHPSSEVAPSIEGRIWSDEDIRHHTMVVEAIHKHGALAAIELCYNGPRPNYLSRLPPMGASAGPVGDIDPVHCRAMDLEDFRAVRRWHRQAALRARKAGYDLVYVYAGHGLTLTQHLLSRWTNRRTDMYGGSLENRTRFLRELLEDTKDAVGHDCAVPLRLAVDEALGSAGLERAEIEDVVASLADLPDLFDFCMGTWRHDSRTARFAAEGFQEPFVRGLKALTQKPVVGVGRFTSPESMAAQIRSGVLDFVGAARPSIADPFLPRKIDEGRADDLRECIGCNVCVSGDYLGVPIRCTQNPTMGEEWRRGWHPERIAAKHGGARILVVGGGPAGLEAAHQLGKRGYEVMLADASCELGGRAVRESRLAGLATYRRVAEYRLHQLSKLSAVTLFPGSLMTADDVLATEATHVALATGARWRRDGSGRRHPAGLDLSAHRSVLTPDDVLDGLLPSGSAVIFDDDHYLMGGALAGHLARTGCRVTLVTPASVVSAWTANTLEVDFIAEELVALGVRFLVRHDLSRVHYDAVEVRDVLTGAVVELAAEALVTVTARDPVDDLERALAKRGSESSHGIVSVARIGDCDVPATVAHAVHAGHLYARELNVERDADALPFRVEPIL
ncbi:MAG: FAD-dependent oxidoreductase [Hyphomicrobiales bacterium]